MINLLKNAIQTYAREMSSRNFGRTAWTSHLFAALGDLGRRAGFAIACSGGRADLPEWLYDLTWLDFDKTPQKRLQGVELALESEWDSSVAAIMQDFNKLLQSRAKIKVMVCAKQGYDVAAQFRAAAARYPGKERCDYVIAVCDFEDHVSPVTISDFDEAGRMRSEGRIEALRRHLKASGMAKPCETVSLRFEGFWPNKKQGFIEDRNGLYFVFAGVRKRTATGYVAELRRVVYIGTERQMQPFAAGAPNAFERMCHPGEIPYFAFAETAGNLTTILEALVYKFRPDLNTPQGEPNRPEHPVRFVMTGAVAECLGPREFLV